MLAFTLVTTVFNEQKRLGQTLADIAAQTRPPAEMVVVDADSTDGTRQILETWGQAQPYPVRVVLLQGCNIAQGRNHAIQLATHALIASTDFGCRFEPGWLESLISPFDADPDLQVTGGAFTVRHAEVDTPAARADYILQNGYPVALDRYFSVSSRSIAFKRSVWQQIGGYQQWLTLAADDTIFWRQIKLGCFKYHLVAAPMVYWLRHKTMRAFAHEAGRYGLGDGESGINFRNFLSNLAETLARWGAFAVLLALPFWVTWQWRFLPLTYLAATMVLAWRSYKAARQNHERLKDQGIDLDRYDLYRAYWLIERSRFEYLRGYIRGWLLAPVAVKQGRRALGALPV